MILRKAQIKDVEHIFELIDYYARQELMLPRTRGSIFKHIRDYSVIELDGIVVGVGALQVIWNNLAEIRSLSIHPDYGKRGLGREMVYHLLEEAKDLGIFKGFTLTYQPGFFQKCGFTIVKKEDLPQKVWTECINCPKFPSCDEIAMVRYL